MEASTLFLSMQKQTNSVDKGVFMIMTKKLWGTKIWDSTGIYYYTEVNIKQGLTHTVPTETIEGYN